jgi:glycosyltransferase involved in cell wall biosynthesis
MISIIIPVGDGRDDNLDLCLYALRLQTYGDFEIVVAADGDHGVAGVLYSHRNHIPITYYHRRRDTHNLGAVNRNVGAKLARGQFLLFIDSDVVLNPRALEFYAEDFRDFPQRAIAGPYHWCAPMRVWRDDIQDWERFAAQAMDLMTKPKAELDPLGFKLNHNIGLDSRKAWTEGAHPEDVYSADYPRALMLLSGNMAISRQLFEYAGGFWEEISRGIDGAFGLALAEAGGSYSFDPRCYGLHLYHDRSDFAKLPDPLPKIIERFHQNPSRIGRMETGGTWPWRGK